MSSTQCKDCKFFRQHYGIDGRQLFKVGCGHCTFPRAKRKCPDAKICENFVRGTDILETFVTKEYLSKELLKYVLKLELLPDIR